MKPDIYINQYFIFFVRAVNGARTRDPQLGKLMLCQLSYYRKPFEISTKDLCFEPIPGLEPGTHALRMRCSTN